MNAAINNHNQNNFKINNHNNDLIIFYDSILFPSIPFDIVFAAYNAKSKIKYYAINCPKCGEFEACVYKNSGIIECNRKNECKYKSNILKFLNSEEQPAGQDFINVIKKLCEVSGIEFPEREYTSQEVTAFTKRDHRKELFDNFKSITVHALFSEEGKEALEYWQLRGLSIQDITKFSLGAYPSSKFIEQELLKKHYLPSEIKESGLCRSDWDGRIIIPIKSNGVIGDFIAGNIKREDKNIKKYLRMNGECAFDNSMLLGLDKAGNDITIVEGPFDYFNLTIAGFENIVALGGCQIWDSHIPTLLKHKIKTITLLLDDDKAGSAAILNNINKFKNEDFEVFVVDPKFLNKMDPDKFIQTYGPKKLKEILQQKVHGFEYLAQSIIEKHNNNGEVNTYAKNKILDEAISFEATINNKNRRLATEEFWKKINKNADISQETIAEYRVEIQEKKFQEESKREQQKKYEQYLYKANQYYEQGNFEALNSLNKPGNPINDNLFEIQPYGLDSLIQDLLTTTPGLKTQYKDLDEYVTISNEAITLIAGRPSHGKTALTLNLLLNMVETYTDKQFYLFSYEETCKQVSLKIINILSDFVINEQCWWKNLVHLEAYLKSKRSNLIHIEAGKATFDNYVTTGRLIIIDKTYEIENLRDLVVSLHKKNPNIGAIFIDYIQKIPNKEKVTNRQLELQKTSEILLDLAKTSSLPLILGAQLGRDIHSKDKVRLSNLRESGDLEQDANLVLGIFNPSMEMEKEEAVIERNIEFRVTPLKNRNGLANKTITLIFDKATLKITTKVAQ